MTHEQIFQLSNTLALAGWLLLLIVPYWKWTARITTGVVITILSALYMALFFSSLNPSDFQNFRSLEGLMGLFGSSGAVLVGWVHYLAFDMMVGQFIVDNAAKHGVNRYIIIPCLLLTFMAGPTGLVLYYIIRTVRTRRYFEPS